ncbi:hypothetical protein DVT68_16250 [Dyella solisilvae]|uniref:Uncharacterized protein n=2 Tax=Dyella solisilvae TaxID=1920168 RepID=A0A370K3T2_9GAMM|nr:hypothetical protein DVT68_16250 [Dyella solisilvae]
MRSTGTNEYVPLASAEDLKKRIAYVQQSLPPSLKDDKVVPAIGAIIARAILQGNAAGLRAANFKVDGEGEIAKLDVPSKLTHGQLKAFVQTLLSDKSAATIRVNSKNRRDPRILQGGSQAEVTLWDYLSVYYEGKYRDIYGTDLAIPSISTTISDEEIAAVLSVVLDYIIDSMNVMPILTSDDTPSDGKTTFYIGNNTKEPTRLLLDPKSKVVIPAHSDKCEWSGDNADLLRIFSNASGDKAATVSSLVSQSMGGFSIGLGFLGKISIGDNKALSTVVKTAASQVANRAALTSLYWAVESRHRAVELQARHPQ